MAWSKRETDALVNWLATDDNFAAMRRATTKMLPCLAQHLQEKVSGCHKTAKQCDHKIRNLKKVYKKMRQKLNNLGVSKFSDVPGDVQQEIIDQFPYFKDFDRLIYEESSLQTSTPHNPNYQPSNSPKASPEFDHSYNKTSQVSMASVDDYRGSEAFEETIHNEPLPAKINTKKCPIDHSDFASRKRPVPVEDNDTPSSIPTHERFRNIQPKQDVAKPEPTSNGIIDNLAANGNQMVYPKWLSTTEAAEKTGVLLLASQINNTSTKEIKPPPGCPFHNKTQSLMNPARQQQSSSSVTTNQQTHSDSASTSPEASPRVHVHLPKIESLINTNQGSQKQAATSPQTHAEQTTPVQSKAQLPNPPVQNTHVTSQPPNKRIRSSSFSSISSVAGMPISMCPVVSGTAVSGIVSGCPVQRGDLALPISTIAAAVSSSNSNPLNASNSGASLSHSANTRRTGSPFNSVTPSPEVFSKLGSSVDLVEIPESPNEQLAVQQPVPNEESMHTTLLSILKIMSEDKTSSPNAAASLQNSADPSTVEKDSAKEMALLLAQHIKSSLAKRDAANKQTLQLQQLQSQIEREMVRAELLYKNGQKLRADKIMDKIDELENELHDLYAKPLE